MANYCLDDGFTLEELILGQGIVDFLIFCIENKAGFHGVESWNKFIEQFNIKVKIRSLN